MWQVTYSRSKVSGNRSRSLPDLKCVVLDKRAHTTHSSRSEAGESCEVNKVAITEEKRTRVSMKTFFVVVMNTMQLGEKYEILTKTMFICL